MVGTVLGLMGLGVMVICICALIMAVSPKKKR